MGAPTSLEEYLQQIGRAGRDGLSSECVLLYNDAEIMNTASFRLRE
jgi:superfamily II DNA helicase RecQ